MGITGVKISFPSASLTRQLMYWTPYLGSGFAVTDAVSYPSAQPDMSFSRSGAVPQNHWKE